MPPSNRQPESRQSTPLGPPNALEGSSGGRRAFAVLAYVLPVVGGLIGLLADGDNPLTRSHARQSLAAVLALVLAFLVWAIGGYVLSLIPIAGPIVAIALFSLVIAMAIFLAANWLISLVMALRGEERTIPFANRLVVRLAGEPQSAKSDA
ncbi:MAG: hypothetical protein OXG85_01910 [Chloroflexi bacterium]|nr:hypothetical protein [Chloroflexota bacterium]